MRIMKQMVGKHGRSLREALDDRFQAPHVYGFGPVGHRACECHHVESEVRGDMGPQDLAHFDAKRLLR